jgi:hypothetical protein
MAARTSSPARPPRGRAAQPPSAAQPAEPRTRSVALLVFAGLLAIYVLNFRMMAAGDSIPTRLLPFSILREGNLNLDEFTWPRGPSGRLPYYVHETDHIYSVSTIATALVITPLYVLPAWWLASHGISYDDVRARVLVVVMERISAAVLAALSAALLFVVLRRLTSWRWALALTLLYALGTSTWSLASQALWPHALAELCLVILCAVFLAPSPSRSALTAAGLVTAIMVANRPQMIVFAAPALLFVWLHLRRHVVAFAGLPVVGAILLLAYNQTIFHHLAGGYGDLDHFNAPLLTGIAGLVISPNRGLLVYTPIMLFAFWGAVQVWRVEAPPWLRWLSIGLALHVVVHGSFAEWWAGYTYGPRYFTDALPALTIFLVYGLVPLCRVPAMRAVAGALALYGVAVQAIGVYAADDRWNREPVPLEQRPDRVWDWGDLQIARAWHNGWHGGDLAGLMLDAFREPLPATLAPLSEANLASTIAARGLPGAARRGATAAGLVTITNRGGVAWPAFSGEGAIGARYQTFLLARWLWHGHPLDGAGDVIALPRNLAPGETVEVPVALTTPAVPGDFELELRITQAIDGVHGTIGADALRVPLRVD